MNTPRTSLLTRVALSSMVLALRFWPENTRQWGLALLAEMEEISEPAGALNWAAGGILLFLRAVLAQIFEWMRLPAGTGFSGAALPGGANGPRFPKHSRLTTAVILLAAVTLFFLPIGREATRTVRASWRSFIPSPGDRRELEKIAAKAEKEKDARALAFGALSYPDCGRALELADRAVALDPSLVWIYASRYYHVPLDLPQSGERLKQLRSSDPENAFAYLVSANVEGTSRTATPLRLQSTSEALRSDGEWMKEMDQAFRATNYDSYFRQHEELVREGWKKTPGLSPGLVAIGLWRHRVPDLRQIQAYADLRVNEALRIGSAGNVKEAETILEEITKLGRRMAGVGGTPIEQLSGLGLMQRGLEGFKKLYGGIGRPKKGKEIDAQLQELETEKNERIQSYMGWKSDLFRAFQWKANVLQVSAILSLLLAIAVALGLFVLEMGAAFRWKGTGTGRWIACRVVDYGPLLFLASSFAFLWSFRPIAEIFAQYRSKEETHTEAMRLFWQVFVLGDTSPVSYFNEPYHQWLVLTVVLAAIGVVVVVRGIVRQKAVASTTR